MKKITFDSRLAAIDWIAARVDTEEQFEILREQLNYNFIYTQSYFLDLDDQVLEKKGFA